MNDFLIPIISNITIYFKGSIPTTTQEQAVFKLSLAHLVHIDPISIHIVHIEKEFLYIILEIPFKDSLRLLNLYHNNNIDIELTNIQDITLKKPLFPHIYYLSQHKEHAYYLDIVSNAIQHILIQLNNNKKETELIKKSLIQSILQNQNSTHFPVLEFHALGIEPYLPIVQFVINYFIDIFISTDLQGTQVLGEQTLPLPSLLEIKDIKALLDESNIQADTKALNYLTQRINETIQNSCHSTEELIDRQRLTYIRSNMLIYFNLEELKDLSFDLSIDYELLSGNTKNAKIRELLLFCERHQNTASLLQQLTILRPHITW